MGYSCPNNTNPADFALDMITVDLQQDDREAESRERVKRLIDNWNNPATGDGDVKEKTTPADLAAQTAAAAANETTSAAVDIKASNIEPEAGGSGGIMTTTTTTTKYEPPTTRKSFNKANVSTPAELGALIRKRTSLVLALPLLLRRAIINTRRQPELIMARTMQVVGVAAVFTLFFAPLHHDYFSIQNRMGFVQQIGAFYFVGMLQNVAVYPSERDVFYREDDDGVYGVDAFLLSYTILEVPFEILSCMIYGVLAIFAVQLPQTVTMYFVTVFACFGIVSCGESLGIMFNTLVSHTGFAVNIMGVFLSVANSMAGVLSIDMPEAFRAVNYLSPIRYATRAVAPYSLWGQQFTCDDEQRLPNGQCPITTGEEVLDLYNFNDNPIVNVACLAACIVIYRFIAWVLLRVTRARWNEKKPKFGKC